ncbi:hypothetical protein M1394_00925 [Candidatus Marsarchaeota archaeon]|nr:hypothetical protein [Candidatus Marsarchaeota archaeon]
MRYSSINSDMPLSKCRMAKDIEIGISRKETLCSAPTTYRRFKNKLNRAGRYAQDNLDSRRGSD